MQRSVISAEWVKSKHENLYGFLDDLLSDVIKLAGRSQRGGERHCREGQSGSNKTKPLITGVKWV